MGYMNRRVLFPDDTNGFRRASHFYWLFHAVNTLRRCSCDLNPAQVARLGNTTQLSKLLYAFATDYHAGHRLVHVYANSLAWWCQGVFMQALLVDSNNGTSLSPK